MTAPDSPRSILLRQIIYYIRAIIESKREYNQLPASNGGYL